MDIENTINNYFDNLYEKYKNNNLISMSDSEALELFLDAFIPESKYKISVYTEIENKRVRKRIYIKETVRELLERFRSFSGVVERIPETLTEIYGIDDQTAIMLNMLSSLYRELSIQRGKSIPFNYETCKDFIVPLFIGCSFEMFYMITIDKNSYIIDVDCLEKGSIDNSHVYIRRVVEKALRTGADSVVFVHNHPAGMCMPSQSDINITFKLHDALKFINVKLIEHFIVTTSAGRELSSMIGIIRDAKIFENRYSDNSEKTPMR